MLLRDQILIALIIDFILGDPRRLPHPVTLIAKYAKFVENIIRNKLGSRFFEGMISACIVYSTAFFTVLYLKKYFGMIHPYGESIFSILVIYTCFAVRSLLKHVLDVFVALKDGDIEEARLKVSYIIGRDTKNLDESEITRAAIESAAENLVDGITAPMFFAFIGGPEMAILYKAVNTLDSTWGYKNERYILFGRFAAKVDDFFNYIPARITAPIISVAAFILKQSLVNSLKMISRDGRKHPSPNSGLSEAAMAGALSIQLGGLNYYEGVASNRPLMGENIEMKTKEHILKSCLNIFVSTVLFFALCYIIVGY